MPRFFYEALDAGGQKISGTQEAKSRDELISGLVSQGMQPLKIKRLQQIEALWQSRRSRFSHDNLLYFTRELADLLGAGIPVERAMAILAESAEEEQVQELIKEIRSDIQGGKKLSEAISAWPAIFDSLYVNMVRVGEMGGVLPGVLSRLGDFLERSRETRKFIINSSIYPCILLFVGILSVFVLVTFVVPKFGQIFEDMNQPVPFATAIIIEASTFVRQWWWVMAIILTAAGVGFWSWIKSPDGRSQWDRIVLKLPVAGPFVRTVQMSRLFRTLGTLLESGVPILKGISLAAEVITNSVIRRAMEDVYKGVRQGRSLSHLMKNTGEFPSLVVHLVAVGEETGALAKMLLKIADDMDAKIQNDTKMYLAMVEPVTIVLMGLVIGGIILSMLMAIFGINDIAM